MKFEEELLKKLISIDSTYENEKEVSLYLCDLLEKEGFEVTKIFVNKNRFNIIAKTGNPKIYLQAHTDTVNPYIPLSEDEDYVYGRGACDTKGSISGMVAAAINSKNDGKRDFGLIFTTGEETTFDGAIKIIEEKIEIPFVIVGEPTSLQIVNEHFGILSFKITAQGKSAHSSKPEEGINAIELLLLAIEKINKIEVYPETILTLAQINGGVADNIIPGEAFAIYSMRVSPNDAIDYVEKIKAILPQNVRIENTLKVASVATKVPQELSFIKEVRTVKYFTELSFFQKGVIIGPGDIAYAHGPDEKLSKKELSESVKIYSQIIENFTQKSV